MLFCLACNVQADISDSHVHYIALRCCLLFSLCVLIVRRLVHLEPVLCTSGFVIRGNDSTNSASLWSRNWHGGVCWWHSIYVWQHALCRSGLIRWQFVHVLSRHGHSGSRQCWICSPHLALHCCWFVYILYIIAHFFIQQLSIKEQHNRVS